MVVLTLFTGVSV